MRAKSIVGVVGMLGLMGCAASHGNAALHDACGVTMAQADGVRVDETRIVSAHVNPRVPVHVTWEGGSLAVRFAHPRAAGALVHLSAESLAPMWPEERVEAERPKSPEHGAVRVVLPDGRFVVCWRQGDTESGYRLMARAWTAGGSPLGTAVMVSPLGEDVLGAPDLVGIDGDHVVAMFAASAGERFDLLAVSLKVL